MCERWFAVAIVDELGSKRFVIGPAHGNHRGYLSFDRRRDSTMIVKQLVGLVAFVMSIESN